MQHWAGDIQKGLKHTQLQLTQTQIDKALTYLDMLQTWNRRYNLTGIPPKAYVSRILFDNWVLHSELTGTRYIDVGTGAGLPGIPLAILDSSRAWVLLDSRARRVRFLKQVVHELGLSHVTGVTARVQTYQTEQMFDGIVSRAFRSLANMIELTQHLAGPKTCFWTLKGPAYAEELQALPKSYETTAMPVEVPGLQRERVIVKMWKKE